MNKIVVYVDALIDPKVSSLTLDTFNQTLSDYSQRAKPNKKIEFHSLRIVGPKSVDPATFAPKVLKLKPDLVVLSGSEKNISDIHHDPWVQAYCRSLRVLTEHLRVQHDQQKSFALFGICFGHQALSYVHGARVKKVSTHVGLTNCFPVAHAKSTFGLCPLKVHKAIPLIAYHGDQVMETPQGFVRTFYSKHCRIQGIQHRHYPMMSIQSHPEFTEEILEREKCDPLWRNWKKATLAQHEGLQFLAKVYEWANL